MHNSYKSCLLDKILESKVVSRGKNIAQSEENLPNINNIDPEKTESNQYQYNSESKPKVRKIK